ncbi:MAG: CPBP family intramembrane glutamic endopeptidase [candidate division WOR-3 bacterium]
MVIAYLIFSFIITLTILRFFIKNNVLWTILKLMLAIIIIISFQMNFNFQLKSFIFGIILFISSVIYFLTSSFIFNFEILKGLSKIKKYNFLFRILAGLIAGISEEVIYRGFLVIFLNSFFHNLFISSTISLFLFLIVHIPIWGILGAIQISIWSIMFYLYFAKTNDILALIIAHSLNDIFFFCCFKYRTSTKC